MTTPIRVLASLEVETSFHLMPPGVPYVNVVLWVLQIVLAALFATAGLVKLTRSHEQLRKSLPWVEDFAPDTVRFIGLVELLGAAGLVLPAATGIAPALTPVAATGLAVVMLLAALTHRRRHEYPAIAVNAVLFVLAVVVAWGRFGPYAI
jgi:uncharacterized membrane protein YphA (DoxX/SURF4 family)